MNNLLTRVNTVDCLIVYLAVADLQQSQKPSMGKFHQHHNPAEHKSDGFPYIKKIAGEIAIILSDLQVKTNCIKQPNNAIKVHVEEGKGKQSHSVFGL